MDDQKQKREPEASPAEIYERHMAPAIFASWVPALVDLMKLKRGDQVLDVACGTGLVARHAMNRVGWEGRVVGLDINPNMLDLAQRLAPELHWIEGSAGALPFSDEAFDAVVCQQGLQFFPDQPMALGEMYRVLVPGGRLALALWCDIETSVGHHALAQGLDRHVGPEVAGMMRTVFSLGQPERILALLEAGGFHQAVIRQEQRLAQFPSQDDFTEYVVKGSVLGRSGVQVSEAALEALIRDVREEIEPYVQVEGLIFPMQSNLVYAIK